MVDPIGAAPPLHLFRAILHAEKEDIRHNGVLRIPDGLEVKYFTPTVEEAEMYARAAMMAFDGPYWIIRVPVLDADAIPEAMEVDGGIRAIVIEINGLASVGAPEILHIIVDDDQNHGI